MNDTPTSINAQGDFFLGLAEHRVKLQAEEEYQLRAYQKKLDIVKKQVLARLKSLAAAHSRCIRDPLLQDLEGHCVSTNTEEAWTIDEQVYKDKFEEATSSFRKLCIMFSCLLPVTLTLLIVCTFIPSLIYKNQQLLDDKGSEGLELQYSELVQIPDLISYPSV